MTIKEIEELSGMDRANIRFYEREGLITPRRMDNGYRDYSEADFQMLLRIKLLRSLHISLEEIKGLQEGRRDISEILLNQINKLEQEKQDVTYAQQVCRALQADQVVFAELDARKYLDGIYREERERGSLYFSVKGDILPQVYHPWPRFFARMLDLFIYKILWSILLAAVFRVNLMSRTGFENMLDSFLAVVIMLFAEPLWLRFLGTTPGKAILGLKIETAEGRHLTYGEGLDRTWGVVSAGMGFNIPIYHLICLWKSYKRCSEFEIQPWDESISYTLKEAKWYRGVLYLGAVGAVLAVLLMAISAQRIPPNRGDLTVAGFSENHNYYAKLFDIDFVGSYLNEDGRWEKSGVVETEYFGIGLNEKPHYQFTIEEGAVTGVSFTIEIRNTGSIVGTYDAQMFLASLAFAGAQREMGIFSKLPHRIESQIRDHAFQDFEFTEAGITFTCDTEYSGFREISPGYLWPADHGTENYYRLDFSIQKDQ